METNFESQPAFRGMIMRLWPYFLVLVCFWLVSIYWWLSKGYVGTFAWVNEFRSDTINKSALYFFTHLGDGLILPAIVLLFFWRRDPALAIACIVAVLLTGLVAQLGKNVFFSDWARPPRVFEHIPGVTIVHPNPPKSNSFPSGHATSIATGGLFFAYASYEWKRWLPSLVGIFTVFLCLTRVFIGVHFPADVFVGSVVGAIGGFLVFCLLYPYLYLRLFEFRRRSSPKSALVVLMTASLVIVAQWLHLILEM